MNLGPSRWAFINHPPPCTEKILFCSLARVHGVRSHQSHRCRPTGLTRSPPLTLPIICRRPVGSDWPRNTGEVSSASLGRIGRSRRQGRRRYGLCKSISPTGVITNYQVLRTFSASSKDSKLRDLVKKNRRQTSFERRPSRRPQTSSSDSRMTMDRKIT